MSEISNNKESGGDDGLSDSEYSLPRDTDGNIDFYAMTTFSDYLIPGYGVFNLSTGLTLIADEDQPGDEPSMDQPEPEA